MRRTAALLAMLLIASCKPIEFPTLPPRNAIGDPGLAKTDPFGWRSTRYDGPMPAVLVLRTLTPPIPILDDTTGERIPNRYWPPYIVVAKQSEEMIKHFELIAEWLDAHRSIVSRHRVEAKRTIGNEYEFFLGDERGMTLDKRAANACRFRLKFLFDGRDVPFAIEDHAEGLLWLPLEKTGDVMAAARADPRPPPAPHPHEGDLDEYASSFHPEPPLIPLRDGVTPRATIVETRVVRHPSRTLSADDARKLVEILDDPTSFGGAECGCIANGCRFVITTDRAITIEYDPASGHLSDDDADTHRILSKKGRHRLAPFCR